MEEVIFKANDLSLIFSKFRDFRDCHKLFDITIVVEDTKFKAHKLILSACSEYFETMFLADFRESQQTEIELKGLSSKSFSLLLDYCYNQTITLNPNNAQDILAAASLLQLTDILSFCADYIKSTISTSNCLGILTISHLYNLEDLADAALSFTLDKFEQIVEDEDSEFVNLDVEWLIKLISHDQLNVSDEVKVYQAVVRWVSFGDQAEREQVVDILLPHIRFPMMCPRSLINLKSIVKASERFRDLVDEAKNHFIQKRILREEEVQSGERFRPRVAERRLGQRIFAVGGWTNEYEPIASVEKYDPYKNSWQQVSSMSGPRCGVGVTIFGNSLYAVGGHDGHNYLKSVERYDIESDTWFKDVADMRSARTSVGVVALGGYIYAIGGQPNIHLNSLTNPQTSLAKVERYDPKSNTWDECPSLLEKRLGAGVTVLNGCIYVVGGADQKATNTVECFDPRDNQWKYVAPMNTSRKHLGCASYNGKIYAVGGRDSTELDTVECYDPARNVWEPSQPMSEKRSGIGLVELDGLLYAVGGNSGDLRLALVEAFDPETGLWEKRRPLNRERLGVGLAVYSKLRDN